MFILLRARRTTFVIVVLELVFLSYSNFDQSVVRIKSNLRVRTGTQETSRGPWNKRRCFNVEQVRIFITFVKFIWMGHSARPLRSNSRTMPTVDEYLKTRGFTWICKTCNLISLKWLIPDKVFRWSFQLTEAMIWRCEFVNQFAYS